MHPEGGWGVLRGLWRCCRGVSEQPLQPRVPVQMPSVRGACPTRMGCCTSVLCRRLSSEVAPSELSPGQGAGLPEAVPGEQLRANEGERGPGCDCPCLSSHHSQTEGHTKRRREKKHRVTERLTDKETGADLTETQKTETVWTANHWETKFSQAWTPAFILLFDILPPSPAWLAQSPTGC